MLQWKLRKRHISPVSQNFSSTYFLIAKFQLVTGNLSLAMIWQMTYTHKLPKLCSATLTKNVLLIQFALKQKMEKSKFFLKTQSPNTFGKMQIFGLF